MKNFNERVYDIVRNIPKGKVMYYGQIAVLAGSPRASRAVGYALHGVSEKSNIPWWRVVFKDGSLPIFYEGDKIQRQLLKKEGVSFKESKVDMQKHGRGLMESDFLMRALA